MKSLLARFYHLALEQDDTKAGKRKRNQSEDDVSDEDDGGDKKKKKPRKKKKKEVPLPKTNGEHGAGFYAIENKFIPKGLEYLFICKQCNKPIEQFIVLRCGHTFCGRIGCNLTNKGKLSPALRGECPLCSSPLATGVSRDVPYTEIQYYSRNWALEDLITKLPSIVKKYGGSVAENEINPDAAIEDDDDLDAEFEKMMQHTQAEKQCMEQLNRMIAENGLLKKKLNSMPNEEEKNKIEALMAENAELKNVIEAMNTSNEAEKMLEQQKEKLNMLIVENAELRNVIEAMKIAAENEKILKQQTERLSVENSELKTKVESTKTSEEKILDVISFHVDGITQIEIATKTGLSTPQVSRILKKLEKDGKVKQENIALHKGYQKVYTMK